MFWGLLEVSQGFWGVLGLILNFSQPFWGVSQGLF